MQYSKRLILLCLLFFSTIPLFAQQVSLADRDITGLWKGFMYNDTTKLNYRYEIAISENSKGKLSGFSHTYFILDDKEFHGVKKIKIKRDGDEIITEDVELIANNYPIKPPKGVHVLNTLKFEIIDSVMVLSGKFATNRTKQYAPATGFIQVERKNDFRQSALIPHLQELGMAKELSFVQEEKIPETKPTIKTETVATPQVAKTETIENEKPITEQPVVKTTPVVKEKPVLEKPVVKTTQPTTQPVVKEKPVPEKPVAKTETVAKEKPITEQPVVKATEPVIAITTYTKTTSPVSIPAAAEIEKRTIETIQSVYYKSDSLVLTLYDNGEVDGDTVSVLMNGKLVMSRVGLSTNAVRKTIYTKEVEESIQLVMYAETLGSLPPNTGLLIVNDGTDRYEIRFSGDMQKSSAIMFIRKK
jgi:hypothetical protein